MTRRISILFLTMLVVGVLGCGEGTRELPDADRARLAEQLAVDIRRFSVQVRPAFYQWQVPIPRGGFAASVYPQITFDRPGHCAFLNSGDALINRHGHYLRLNACYRSADASDTLGIHAVAVAVGDVTTTAEYRYEVGSIWGHSRLESSPSGEPVEASDHQTGSFDLYRAVAEAPDSVPVRIELIGDRGTRTYLLTAEEREGWCYFTRCWKTDGYTQHPLVARMLSVARSARN